MYELCLGTEQNTSSYFRSSFDTSVTNWRFGSVFAEGGSTRIFEIDWSSNHFIKIYEYGSTDLFFNYAIKDIKINYLMVSTGSNSEGEWSVWFR